MYLITAGSAVLQFIEAQEKTMQELEIRLNVLKSEPNSDGLTQLKSRLQKELDQAKIYRLDKIREVLRCEMEYSNLEHHVKANHDAQLYKPRNLTRKQLNDAFLNDSNYKPSGVRKNSIFPLERS